MSEFFTPGSFPALLKHFNLLKILNKKTWHGKCFDVSERGGLANKKRNGRGHKGPEELNKMTTVKKLTTFLATGAVAALLVLPAAQAVPFTTDLTVTATVDLFDTEDNNSVDPIGICGAATCPVLNASESGTGGFLVGGAASATTADLAGPKSVGPVGLTDLGDNVSAVLGVSGIAPSSDIADAVAAAELGLSISNAGSASTAYIVTIAVTRSLGAIMDALAGQDTIADASATVGPPSGAVDDIVSADAFFSVLDDSLGPVTSFFDVFVDIGTTVDILGVLVASGTAFDPLTGFSSDGDLTIAIDDVAAAPAPAPATVPEPGALALFGVGLIGLGFMRRRRRTA